MVNSITIPYEFINAQFGRAGKILGSELGPSVIDKSFSKFKHQIQTKCLCDSKVTDKQGIEIVDEVFDYATALGSLVSSCIKHGKIPITIGGDHSISIGTISGLMENSNALDMGVIYIDAHADMNSAEESPTGNIHGMGLASLMGESGTKLDKIVRWPLNPNNILLIGTRSIDYGEEKRISKNGISVIHNNDIHEDQLNSIYKYINRFLVKNKLSTIHLSIDIDVLDPSVAPATGVPEKNGMKLDTLINIIEDVLLTGKVKSVDLVEYNPLLDSDGQTLNVALRILDRIIEVLNTNI